MKLAVVDLGTNTCRLLLAEVRDGAITGTELRRTEVVRLGEGVDQTGRLAAAAVQRTLIRLREYATLIEGYAPERRLLIATSALRDAADGRRFLARVERELGLPWRVIDGEEEAALAFRGAVACTPVRPGRILVFDIGGGSTELAIGSAAPEPASHTTKKAGGGVGVRRAPRPERSWSVDVGAVRLTERFLTADPPTIGQWRQAVRHTRTLLSRVLSEEERQVDAGIGVAGTITTLVANHLGLREYRTDPVNGRELSLATIETAIHAFRPLTSDARALLPGIEPGREDVILAGALIAREVCRLFGLSTVLCSEADILEGAILTLAEGRD